MRIRNSSWKSWWGMLQIWQNSWVYSWGPHEEKNSSRLFFVRVDTVTGNLAVISRFHLFQIKERYDFFSFFETLFYTKLPFPLPWWSKDLLVEKHAGGGQSNSKSTFWSSGKNADCIFGDRSASSMSKWRPAWTLTPEMIPFGAKSVTLSMLIDLLTSTMSCRSTQVKIASTDLWPQEMFTFSKMLALVESESSFGAYVCHRRPGGSTANRDLVDWVDEVREFHRRAEW